MSTMNKNEIKQIQAPSTDVSAGSLHATREREREREGEGEGEGEGENETETERDSPQGFFRL